MKGTYIEQRNEAGMYYSGVRPPVSANTQVSRDEYYSFRKGSDYGARWVFTSDAMVSAMDALRGHFPPQDALEKLTKLQQEIVALREDERVKK